MSMSDNPEAQERAAFEADAEPMGFDLTRQQLAVPEPLSEYRDADTGHRWAGWLARADRAALAQQAATPTGWRDVIQQARESICAGGFAENQQHERSVVEPYLDGVYDELEELERAASRQAATPAPAEPVAVFEAAMRQTWQMIDPLRPEGEPVSYARGQYTGIVAALRTVRDNFEIAVARFLAAPPATPAALPAGPEDMAVYKDIADNYQRTALAAPPAAQAGDEPTRQQIDDWAAQHAKEMTPRGEYLLTLDNVQAIVRAALKGQTA